MIAERSWSTIVFAAGVWTVALVLFWRAIRRAVEEERAERERSG